MIVILAPSNTYLALLFVLGTFLSGCSELSEYDNRMIREALGDSLLNSTETWGMQMEIVDEGNKVLRLEGSYSETFRGVERTETKISGPVTIYITPAEGKENSTVYCDSALYLPDKGIFEMYGNVKVFTESGKKLRSDYLQWKRLEDQLYTPEFVIFINPPDSIAANGFKGNTDFTSYTLNEGGGQVVID